MSGRDLGHFGCDGRYRLSDAERRSFVEFVMDGVKQVQQCEDEGCPHHGTPHFCFNAARTFEQRHPEPGFPSQPPNLGVASARDVLREQSELISKYAAELDKFMQTHECRRNCDTCTELRSRATLARDISLIYFRAATLEV